MKKRTPTSLCGLSRGNLVPLQLLPLRVDLEKNPVFRDLVALNAQTASTISEHGQVSLAQFAEAVAAKNFDFSTGLHPVFQAAFILNGSEEAKRLGQGFK